MSADGRPGADADAEAILRRAARPERLWPGALVVLALYLGSSIWRIERPFGTSGREAVLHALPTVWVPLLLAAVVVVGRVGSRVERQSGGSPWRWPRIARRTLIGLAVALPVLCFGVGPVVAVSAADSGTTDVGPPLSLVVDIGITVE